MKILREVEGSVEVNMKPARQDTYELDDWRLKENCSCQNYSCGCCLHLEVPQISLNDTGCLNITYLVDEYGFEFLFSIDGKIIIDKKVSVKNPPPICAAIPYIHNLASLCVRFYNLDYKEKQFSGCAALEAELEGIVVKKIELGCFKIPPSVALYRTHRIAQP